MSEKSLKNIKITNFQTFVKKVLLYRCFQTIAKYYQLIKLIIKIYNIVNIGFFTYYYDVHTISHRYSVLFCTYVPIII